MKIFSPQNCRTRLRCTESEPTIRTGLCKYEMNYVLKGITTTAQTCNCRGSSSICCHKPNGTIIHQRRSPKITRSECNPTGHIQMSSRRLNQDIVNRTDSVVSSSRLVTQSYSTILAAPPEHHCYNMIQRWPIKVNLSRFTYSNQTECICYSLELLPLRLQPSVEEFVEWRKSLYCVGEKNKRFECTELHYSTQTYIRSVSSKQPQNDVIITALTKELEQNGMERPLEQEPKVPSCIPPCVLLHFNHTFTSLDSMTSHQGQ